MCGFFVFFHIDASLIHSADVMKGQGISMLGFFLHDFISGFKVWFHLFGSIEVISGLFVGVGPVCVI